MAVEPEAVARSLGKGIGAPIVGKATTLLKFIRAKPLGGFGIIVIVSLATAGLLAPVIAPHDPLEISVPNRFLDPQWTHGNILGTDHLGRDVMSRLFYGIRASFFIAAFAVGLGAMTGWTIGLVTAFYGKWVDLLSQRVIDIMMSFPLLVLALAIVAVLGQSTRNLILIIALIGIPTTVRVNRSVILSVKESDYVTAARAMGAVNMRIIFRHVAPQTFAVVIVGVSASLGGAVLVESSLSFLGLGTPPPNPSLGQMLSDHTLRNIHIAPWNAVTPGICLSAIVFGFNLLGDSLRDVLDPRLRRGGH